MLENLGSSRHHCDTWRTKYARSRVQMQPLLLMCSKIEMYHGQDDLDMQKPPLSLELICSIQGAIRPCGHDFGKPMHIELTGACIGTRRQLMLCSHAAPGAPFAVSSMRQKNAGSLDLGDNFFFVLD